MRIVTLTFHRAHNYGAVLQAYALQKIIEEELKTECDVMDYRNPYIEWTYRLIRFDDFLHPKTLLRHLYFLKRNIVMKYCFAAFRNHYLKQSEGTYNPKNIKEIAGKYDLFITGSDQVWNGNLTGNDDTYYLNFLNKASKRASYAASFGVHGLGMNTSTQVKAYLKDFAGISVREQEGINLLHAMGLKGEVVLDPTFLLERAAWEKLAKDPKENQKYVLIFIMTLSKTLLEEALQFSKKHNCVPIYINLYDMKTPKGMKVKTGVCVNKWLGYIKGAEYIFTNSFHAMAFSIIFEKQFFYEKNRSKGAPNSRFESLMKVTGIQNREIGERKVLEENRQIDYQKVKEQLEGERKKSIGYLRKIIQDKKKEVEE
ncbi:MAG: polysaccharide pyruvyl transferase family protein [Lachnospiraceae bacterium]|nr:polysaccharide pyruvyl transferase family protein [Lachnospiraceae bacterium]